jgi:hypothetical protein
MAEDDIAFLLNRGKLVEPHEIKENWKVKMAEEKGRRGLPPPS